jgi:hypothetical protein
MISKDKSEESWRDIPSWEGMYQASNYGRIRSLDRVVCNPLVGDVDRPGRILKPSRPGRSNRYPQVTLSGEGRRESCRVHVAVCEAFHGPSNGLHACHLDGNPENNRADNLAWGTPQENNRHKFDHGTVARGEDVGGSVLTETCVHIMRAMWRTGDYSLSEIAGAFGVIKTTAHHAVSGRNWKHLPGASYAKG